MDEELMGRSLDEKIEKSKEVIKEAMARHGDDLVIAITGGKDSTLMLWLFKQACDEEGRKIPDCMFIDEGYVFEEILEFVDRLEKDWGLTIHRVKNTDVSKGKKVGDMVRVSELNERNRMEIQKLGFEEEEFPFEPESYVGNHLMKTVAMNMFLEDHGVKALATAIRWDEQTARTAETFFSPRPDHVRVQPILHFTERNVWEAIRGYDIPFCKLYSQGYRSLGAKGTTIKTSDVPAWEQDLENTPERAGRGQGKEEIMGRLRDLGYM
jgi:phosphoadenosine phosphosulfate reductase